LRRLLLLLARHIGFDKYRLRRRDRRGLAAAAAAAVGILLVRPQAADLLGADEDEHREEGDGDPRVEDGIGDEDPFGDEGGLGVVVDFI
jgi:hypothetical protein